MIDRKFNMMYNSQFSYHYSGYGICIIKGYCKTKSFRRKRIKLNSKCTHFNK